MVEILPFTGETYADLEPEVVLNGALEANLTDALVIGYTESGEIYFASSVGDAGAILWLLEKAKKSIVDLEF